MAAGIHKQTIYKNFYGTISSRHGYNAEQAAEQLHNAMKGFGCDKNGIMNVIIKATNAQRQQIRAAYEVKYKDDLVDRLKKELSGEFEDVIVGLMLPPLSYDVVQLHNAIKGLGTRESTLIDILCTRSNEEILTIRKEYAEKYNSPLEKDVAKDTSGEFRELLLSLLRADREKGHMIDMEKAKQDARKMIGYEKEKIKPDKATYATVFGDCNYAQAELTFQEYQRLSGQTIQKGIKSVFDGDAREAYMQLCSAIHSIPNYYATQLYESMKGLGTRDTDLIRIIVSRSERDLEAIKEEYKRTFQVPLVNAITSDCRGAYRDALIALVEGN